MGLFEKDYLLRMLEQLTQMMEAIRRLAAAGRAREALDSVAEARQTLAGPLAGSLERLDAASVVALLGAEKSAAYVEILRLEGDLHADLKDADAAARARSRADAVFTALPASTARAGGASRAGG